MSALKITKTQAPEAEHLQVIPEVILETANFQTIQTACKVARKHKRFIGISGEPGVGKTVAFQYFQRENANIFLITVKPSMGSKTFWMELMEMVYGGPGQASSSTYKRPLYFTLKRVCERLNALETPLLIIDEAGKLTKQMLLNLHELRDETRRNVGVILAGPEYFRQNLDHWAARNEEGIPELITRINSWIQLQTPTAHEFKSICKEYHVNDAEIVKALVHKVDNFRTLHNRIADYIIENTSKF